LQASLSLPGSPKASCRPRSSHSSVSDHQIAFPHAFWTRPASRSSVCDRRHLQSYIDAQKNLPYVDDSAAVTPMSEESLAFPVVPPTANMSRLASRAPSLLNFEYEQGPHRSSMGAFYSNSSRHSSYTSHSSRISYTSHGDIYGRLGFATSLNRSAYWQRDYPCDTQLRRRSKVRKNVGCDSWLFSHSIDRILMVKCFTTTGMAPQITDHTIRTICYHLRHRPNTSRAKCLLWTSNPQWPAATSTCKASGNKVVFYSLSDLILSCQM